MEGNNQKQGKPNDMRLNKFIAHAGVCSRRKADELIENGEITVNGKVVLEVGTRVLPTDKIYYQKKRLMPEKQYYILLNKPKDCLSTVSDDRGRKTVIDLIGKTFNKATNFQNIRLYPVGRLDRNTTGLLMLSNDGDLAKRLTHPSHQVKKVYRVELNKPVSRADMDKIGKGIILEDGKATIDKVAWPEPKNKFVVGIEIHIGRNRIVRRIFEHLGYDVVKLDRVVFADLTKKDLPRGKWRFLTDQEIIRLKHFNKVKRG